MSRLGITALLLTSASAGIGCAQEEFAWPRWDVHSAPGRGHSWEGSIQLNVEGDLPPELTWDETNVSLIAWPEGVPVAATVTATTMEGTTAPTWRRLVIEPTAPLERDRWYAVKWDAPPGFATSGGQLSLEQALLPSGDFAWPFWSTSEPRLYGATWLQGGMPLRYGIAASFSAPIDSEPDYAGRLQQGGLECSFERANGVGRYVFAPCPDLDLEAPFTLTFDGLRSAASGERLSQITAEAALMNLGPDNWQAVIARPYREPPPYAGP